MKFRILSITGVLFLVTLFIVPTTYAYNVQLADQNSLIHGDSFRLWNWVVDGTDILVESSFLVGYENSEDTYFSAPFQSPGTTYFDMNGNGQNEKANGSRQWSPYRLDIAYELAGDTAGSKNSALKQTLTITNSQSSSYDFRLYNANIFRVNGTVPNAISRVDGDTITQYDATQQIISNVDVLPDHYEITNVPTVLGKIFGGGPTTLSDSIVGSSYGINMNWGWQWNFTLDPNESFTIVIDRTYGGYDGPFPPTTVPEPSTLLLFGTGLVGIGVFRRKFTG